MNASDLGHRQQEQTPQEAVISFVEQFTTLRNEVNKIIVGQEQILDGIITCLLAGGHALLEGVPGLGKTMLVRQMAAALDLDFSRIQFTPDLMPADIIGTTIIIEEPTGKKSFNFQRGPIFTNVVLADEINRATPKTQSALLEAMQEQSVTVSKTTHQLQQPFIVLATQNPLEMEGTYPLPEAQLDRFFFKLQVDFPNRKQLHEILDRTTGTKRPEVHPVLDRDMLLRARELVRQVAVAHHVQDYTIRIMEATHEHREEATHLVRRYVRYGASPRGAQACITAAKVQALFDGRFHVSVDDVRMVAKPALRHRIILNFEGEAEGITADQVLDEILSQVSESQV